MNNYKQVDAMVEEWKGAGLAKEKIVANVCEAELGWPYVWGACAAQCTTSKREYYAGRENCPADEKKVIRSTCPVLSGKQQKCDGCQWFPGGERVLIDDCWGFAKQNMSRVGIKLDGYGCTSGWNAKSNWSEQGEIANMPNVVCCVFVYDRNHKDFSHIGIHVGGGRIIHCSGEVKTGKITDKGWTHYAIPNGLEGDVPVPTTKPTLRKGATGHYVVECQEDLLKLGYDLSPYGADGKYGDTTIREVKKFQTANGLTADGICGPMTWAALDDAIKPDPTPKTDYYTVTIRHLTLYDTEALKARYDGAVTIEKE